jgi:hypothetical protein
VKARTIALTAALGVLAAFTVTSAQQQIIGGHALDNNLRVGSSGFNTRSGGGLKSPSYRPATRTSYGQPRTVSYAPTRASGQRLTVGGATGGVSRQSGFSSTGFALSSPTYNPLSPGVKIQRSPTGQTRPTSYTASYGRRPSHLAHPSYTTIRRGQ